MKILEPRFGRGGEGRRHDGYESGSCVSGPDPVQNLGVRAVTFYRG